MDAYYMFKSIVVKVSIVLFEITIPADSPDPLKLLLLSLKSPAIVRCSFLPFAADPPDLLIWRPSP